MNKLEKILEEYNKIFPFETFEKMLLLIEEQESKNKKVQEALKLVCDGFFIYDAENCYLKALLELIETILTGGVSPNDTLSWYLYEAKGTENAKYFYNSMELEITPYILYIVLILENPKYKNDIEELNEILFNSYGKKEN